MHLFAGPEAGEDDLHVGARALAHKSDELVGKIDDLDRFAHVEDEDLAALAYGRGFQYELGRFGDKHKVARHVRVRDGDGTALYDLLPEEGKDAAGGTKDVAEPDGDESGGADGVKTLDEFLRHSLCGAHDRARLDGLVSRDLDEFFAAGFVGGAGDLVSSLDVVQNSFQGVQFHNGNVLVGCGVEDDLGMVLAEDGIEPGFVFDVRDVGADLKFGELGSQLAVDLVKVEFAELKQDQLFRLEERDLTAHL